jgi:hypothetical protein
MPKSIFIYIFEILQALMQKVSKNVTTDKIKLRGQTLG